MKSGVRRGVWWLLAGTLALGLMAACGGAAEPEATPAAVAATPTTVGAAPAPTATPADQPQYGGVFRVSSSNPRIGQDPHKTTGSSHFGNFGHGTSSLLRFQHGEEYGQNVTLIGDLAESWEISEDGRTWTLHIRRGVKWHNIPPVNGREFTADDAVFSLRRLANPDESVHAGYWINMESVEAPDRYTVKLVLKKAQANFAFNLALGYHKMVAPEAVEQAGGDLREGPQIGTGPWLITCEVDVGCTGKRNPDFHLEDEFGNQLPYLDEIRNIVFEDVGARFAAFRGQQLDYHGALPAEVQTLEKSYPEVVIKTTHTGGGYIIFINQEKEPWRDERVRMALSIGFSRDEVAQATYALKPGEIRYGTMLGVGVPDLETWKPTQEEMAKAWTRDVTKAKQLLADAGYPNGFDGEYLVARYEERNIPTAEIMIAQLAEAGIRLTMSVTDPPGYLSRCYTVRAKRGYEDICGQQLGTPVEQGMGMLDFLHSAGGRNSGGISDPVLDKMIEDQATEMDPEKRRLLHLDIQRYAFLEKNNLLALQDPPSPAAMWPWVKNYSSVNDYPAWTKEDHVWYDQALYQQYKR